MENNLIKLQFDNTIVALAGYDYGVDIFKSLVGNDVDLDNPITIEIPDSIQIVASSFVEGFFSKWVEKYGYEYVLDKVKVICTNERVEYAFRKYMI